MADKYERIADAIGRVSEALTELRDLMKEPSGIYFGRIHPDFERLERVMASKSVIDASFAYIADRDDAGRQVNSSRAVDYLTARLGIPARDAHARLDAGRKLFAPIPEPEPTPEPDYGDDLTPEAEAAAEEKRQKEEEAREAERRAEEERRRKLFERPVPQYVLDMIEKELEHLNEGAVPGPAQLRAQATEKAHTLGFVPLREWLRDAIRMANKATDRNRDNATRKRTLTISKPDADGGIWINGYVDAPIAAMLKAAFAPGRLGALEDIDPQSDERTFAQRMVDHLGVVLHQYLLNQQSRLTGAEAGVGSILITATLEDLENLNGQTRFATNTGVILSPLDVLRLGMAPNDLFCLVDDKGIPLNLERTKRLASLGQKIALAVRDLVCSRPGCDAPWIECDVHHIVAWSAGGATNLSNLTLQCRPHHSDNNDFHDGANNMGHMDTDFETGRVGFAAPGEVIQFNESAAASRAAGRRAARCSVRGKGSDSALGATSGADPDPGVGPPRRKAANE